jgi:hypothetical protein
MGESLWNLRTPRDIKLPGETFSHTCLKTMGDLTGIEENIPYSVDEHLLASLKEKDRQQFAKQEVAIKKARENLLMMRSKLKGIKEQNRERSRYRRQLMDERHKREAGKEKEISAAQSSCSSCMSIEY